MKNKIIVGIGTLIIGGLIYTGMNYDLNKKKHNVLKPDKDQIVLEITADYDSIYDNANTEELETRSELILIGNVKSIDGVINYSEEINEYMMTSTIGTIEVKDIIKSNQLVNESDVISFIRVGGTISVAEYEKSLTPRQIIRQGIINMTEEEKENTYVKFSYEDDVEIEEGKDYLIYLKYDTLLNTYRIIGMQYGLKEYNEDTHEVKDNQTNNWNTLQYNI